ncbi:hypothetical protein BC936DRAFT_136945, partial [Jimgerdemannia flammicorona]
MEVLVAGHSAGGQMVQRCAGSSVPVKYVVANAETCTWTSSDSRSRRARPRDERLQLRKLRLCLALLECRRGKYGLCATDGYIVAVGDAVVAAALPILDVLNDGELDTSCEAEAEGWTRKQRGLVWERYLYLMQNVSSATQAFKIIPGCGYNETCMFQSSEFLSELMLPAGTTIVAPRVNGTNGTATATSTGDVITQKSPSSSGVSSVFTGIAVTMAKKKTK